MIEFTLKQSHCDIATKPKEIKTITREHYELYANKLDNLVVMDKFLEIHKLPKQTQEETEKFRRPVTSTEIESKNLPTKKSPELNGFTDEF